MKKVTVWLDPHDAGLRVERGHWIEPREAKEQRPHLFQRPSAEVASKLAQCAGALMPKSPGEFAWILVPGSPDESDYVPSGNF